MNCYICGRELDKIDDPLARDCGGDCWGCVGEIEANSGYEPSVTKVRKEFELGLRPGWNNDKHNDGDAVA